MGCLGISAASNHLAVNGFSPELFLSIYTEANRYLPINSFFGIYLRSHVLQRFFGNFVSYPTTFGSALSRLGKHVIGFPCPFFVSISRSKSFRYALLHHRRGYTAGAYATHIRLTCPGGSWIEVLVCFLIQFFWFFSFYFLIFGTLEGHVGGAMTHRSLLLSAVTGSALRHHF